MLGGLVEGVSLEGGEGGGVVGRRMLFEGVMAGDGRQLTRPGIACLLGFDGRKVLLDASFRGGWASEAAVDIGRMSAFSCLLSLAMIGSSRASNGPHTGVNGSQREFAIDAIHASAWSDPAKLTMRFIREESRDDTLYEDL
jgi:hypothetical protein